MELEIEGLRNLRVDFAKASAKAGDGVMKGLQGVGLEIVAEAKQNLNQNKTNNSGALRASGKVQKDGDVIDAGFFAEGSSEGYASHVEYGRGPTKKAGQIPLRTTLRAWVHRKLGIPYGKELESATYLIARKIHRKGTKAQPFFAPAVKKFEDKVSNIVSEYVDKSLK